MKLETENRSSGQASYAPDPAPPRLGGTDALRGVMVVLTALVVGAVIMVAGLDGGSDGSLASSSVGAEGEVDPLGTGASSGSAESSDLSEDESLVDGANLGAALDSAVTDPGVGADDSATVGEGATAGESATGGIAGGVVDESVAGTAAETGEGTATTSDVLPDGAASSAGGAGSIGVAATARPASEVKVVVLNGAGTKGIAYLGSVALENAGFQIGTAKNAEPSQQPSAIYYAEGYELEALEVGEVFATGLDDLLEPLTDANKPISDTQSAHVLVVLGNDGVISVP